MKARVGRLIRMREAIEIKGKGNTKLYREDYSESEWEDILRFMFGISDKEILELRMVKQMTEQMLSELREITDNLVEKSADIDSDLVEYVDSLSEDQLKLSLLKICLGGYVKFN